MSSQQVAKSGVVIVGGGLAAANTAETLRSLGYELPITIISEEPTLPYERPPLSKEFLLGKKEIDDAIAHDAAWYQHHNVTVVLGERVTEIDRSAHTVTLALGTVLPYDTLVLATGARSRTLPDTEAQQLTLRRVEDAQYIREQIPHGGQAVIVGAGWIGLEVASSARQQGMEVTVIAPGKVPLGKIMGERIGEHFAELHRKHGVELKMETKVTGVLEKAGQITGLATSAGDVQADRILIAIGAVPNTELAEAAGLEVDNGVVTDASLRTSDPDILAAGDVANAEHLTLGRLRVEHWDNAIRQGKLAAQTIMGTGEQYDWQPYFFTDQFDLGMEYVGHADASAEVVVRGDMAAGEFIVFWLSEGIVKAAMNVNIWDVNDDLRALIGRKIDRSGLENPDIPLTKL
ncbi:NAD(P)/FAD-dependent oxidoreductase [Gulosibacter chungangensis]|uniref:Ferredoxin reductase n=1 Tax=Gulosibacter chungangensis TaxID=979746 RepID=A0A7J5BCK9_9MICO|nr:FAD-dependent oxidoreductase [Gulosibacter chungangensis]KAB1643911.1 hypothetical protein F8O05_03675 [Gulosibacter chungangensis]